MKLPAIYNSLSWQDRRRAREQYAVEQGGNCWYCKSPLSEKSIHEARKTPVNWWRFPKDFLKYPVHLHHDHKTGMTIGAVHSYCNAVSFDYDESPVKEAA